jgi:hypothetical protein
VSRPTQLRMIDGVSGDRLRTCSDLSRYTTSKIKWHNLPFQQDTSGDTRVLNRQECKTWKVTSFMCHRKRRGFESLTPIAGFPSNRRGIGARPLRVTPPNRDGASTISAQSQRMAFRMFVFSSIDVEGGCEVHGINAPGSTPGSLAEGMRESNRR